ncbi:MAG: phosphatidylserine decarboxylase [Patescibacteria group bacterium]|nr:phosphatidylserine decarboxylase [Patescibacteria group bacterium]
MSDDKIDQDDSVIISPTEAKLTYTGKIETGGQLISKFGKKIGLAEILEEKANLFKNGSYFNFYLSPKNKHYWRIPCDSKLVSTKVNNGKARIPIVIGLEKFFPGTDFFEKAIKSNAAIGSVFQTKNFPYAIIAVGSLNVNSIRTIKKDYFKKGDIGGYFNLGSSILLCFPNYPLTPLISAKTEVRIGEPLIKINSEIEISNFG